MGIYGRFVYPHWQKLTGQLVLTPEVGEIFQEQARRYRGPVLEIGVGSGGMLPLYDPGKVDELYGLDPHPAMMKQAGGVARDVDVPVRLLCEGAEDISLSDGSVDTVISTYTFCTIPDLPRALAEIRRVLRPGGELVVEHGLDPDPTVARWQRLEEPLHERIYQGCHVTRDIAARMKEAGFDLTGLEEGRLPLRWCPPGWKWSWWGGGAARDRIDGAASRRGTR